MTLVFLGIVSTVSVYFLDKISKDLMEERNVLSIVRLQLLVNEVTLVLRDSENCWKSLGSPPAAPATGLSLFYTAVGFTPNPMPTPPPPLVVGSPLANTSMHFRGFRLTGINLTVDSKPRISNPAYRVYLGNLNLTAVLPNWPTSIVRSTLLYVVQTISPVAGWQCMTTEMPNATQTVEDWGCQLSVGKSRYDPHLKKCY